MKKNLSPLYIVITILGIGGGFAYYYYIGCSTGTCPLKSNPWIMMGYGGFVGYLVADITQWIINKLKKDESNTND